MGHTRIRNYLRDETPEWVLAEARETSEGERLFLAFHCPFCFALCQHEISSNHWATWPLYRCGAYGGGEFEVHYDMPNHFT